MPCVLRYLAVVPAAPSQADAWTNVAEATEYRLVYTLDIPRAANHAAAPVPYAADHHLAIAGPFDRVAYYLELVTPAGQLQYVYASMDAFTQDRRAALTVRGGRRRSRLLRGPRK